MLSLSFKPMSKRLPSVIMVFFLMDLALCIAYVIYLLIGEPFHKLKTLLDLNGESSVASWYSSTQLFCIFLLSAIFCHYKIRQNKKSFPLLVLPAIYLLMSIDESVQIHEWLGQQSDILFSNGSRLGTSFHNTGLWMFVFGLPFLAIFILCAYSLKPHFSGSPSALKKLVLGMIIMLIGALGFETLSNFVKDGFLFIEVLFEEGLEMVGVTVMLWAIYEVTLDYISDLVRRDIQCLYERESQEKNIPP